MAAATAGRWVTRRRGAPRVAAPGVCSRLSGPSMQRPLRFAARLLPALLAVVLIAVAIRHADLGRALALVHSLGWALPLLLLPNLLAMAAEAAGLRAAVEARLPPAPTLQSVLGVRLITESFILGLPSGSLVNESMQPYLLKTRCGLPLERAIPAAVARKFLVVLSQGVFLLLATLLTWRTLDAASRATIGRGGLPWLLLAAGVALVVASLGGALATARGRVADRLHRGIRRIGGRWFGPWLERNASRFQSTDAGLASLFTERPASLGAPLLLYLLGWFIRSLETLIFLRLLGAEVSLASAMVLETALILVRAMAVPVPGGLGVQDLGYVLSLRALGIHDAATLGTAFVVMKRGKDLFWVLVGFLALAAGRRHRRSDAGLAGEPTPSG